MSVSDLNKLIYRKFGALSGGSCNRSIQTVVARKDLLEHSYDFIRDFLDSQRDQHGDVDWFSLSTSEQRALMKTAGARAWGRWKSECSGLLTSSCLKRTRARRSP